MQTSLDCIPCFFRQTLEAGRFVTDDTAVLERLVRDVLEVVSGMDLSQSPPAVAQQIHRSLRRLTGVEDPYRAAKDRFNAMALDMLAEGRQKVEQAADPLAMAVRLAIAGNVIDLGVDGGLTEEYAREQLNRVMDDPFHGDMDWFRKRAGEARSILYLADNAGEIVFDRLLVEQLPLDRVTLVVRGMPVLNDATMIDAKVAGLCDIVEVIDNGSDAPGTILEDCSEAFQKRFADADLILAKGQGNYESLSSQSSRVCFMFKAKCPVI